MICEENFHFIKLNKFLIIVFRATKFVKIMSEAAIRNYPDRNLPTLLIYNKTDIVQQFVGLAPFGGEGMTTAGTTFPNDEIG